MGLEYASMFINGMKKWVVNSLDCNSLNKIIEGMLSVVRNYCLECIEKGLSIDFDSIAQKLNTSAIEEKKTSWSLWKNVSKGYFRGNKKAALCAY